MAKDILVSKRLLRDLLNNMEAAARAIHCRYDRKAKKYIWNDEVWKKADPFEFKIVSRARAALLGR